MILRADLPLGIAGAMIIHAAGETGPAPPHTTAVLLQTADEAELLELYDFLAVEGFEPHLIREPDPPFNGQAMALALRPGTRRRELRKLCLWKGAPR